MYPVQIHVGTFKRRVGPGWEEEERGEGFSTATLVLDSSLSWVGIVQELISYRHPVGILVGDLKSKVAVRRATLEEKFMKPLKKF